MIFCPGMIMQLLKFSAIIPVSPEGREDHLVSGSRSHKKVFNRDIASQRYINRACRLSILRLILRKNVRSQLCLDGYRHFLTRCKTEDECSTKTNAFKYFFHDDFF